MIKAIKIPVSWYQHITVVGGPFREIPEGLFGVKMAEEIKQECFIDIPTRDYSTPDPKLLDRGMTQAVCLALCGVPLYVGCWGGIGRTGLFLAILCKSLGVKNPVEYVRKHYNSHAVETKDQYAFVQSFVINPQIRMAVKNARHTSWVRFWRRGITRTPSLTNQPDDATLRK